MNDRAAALGRLRGKVAIITGSARGLGAAFATALIREGAHVMLTDVLAEEGASLAATLGDGARFESHDVTQEEHWQRIVAATERCYGPVSVLVNNAGVVAFGAIDTLEEKDYRRVIDTNQLSVFLGIKSVLGSMRRAGGGSIINISSVAGFVGTANLLSYTASKFAVRGMTKAAAIELAPDSIRVNSIHPGIIRTPMTAPTEEAALTLMAAAASTPAKRYGEPEEVASIVVMLASDETRFTTGAEFAVDGGFSCQ